MGPIFYNCSRFFTTTIFGRLRPPAYREDHPSKYMSETAALPTTWSSLSTAGIFRLKNSSIKYGTNAPLSATEQFQQLQNKCTSFTTVPPATGTAVPAIGQFTSAARTAVQATGQFTVHQLQEQLCQ
jgi:hypothetical protein